MLPCHGLALLRSPLIVQSGWQYLSLFLENRGGGGILDKTNPADFGSIGDPPHSYKSNSFTQSETKAL